MKVHNIPYLQEYFTESRHTEFSVGHCRRKRKTWSNSYKLLLLEGQHILSNEKNTICSIFECICHCRYLRDFLLAAVWIWTNQLDTCTERWIYSFSCFYILAAHHFWMKRHFVSPAVWMCKTVKLMFSVPPFHTLTLR